MEKVNMTTEFAYVSGTTPVYAVIPEFHKAKAAVRRFSGLGDDAASAVTWYRPRATMTIKLLEALAANGTTVKVPVDVAGGHVVKGHTLTTSDKLLLLTGTGWKVVAISAVADVSEAGYCAATISAVGAVIPANTQAYVVRAADIVAGLPAIGSGSVVVDDFICGDLGAPLVFSVVSASGKTTAAAAFVEYFG